jgi:hypothetical protein
MLDVCNKSDVLIVDGNCILHDVVSDYQHLISPDIEVVINAVVERFRKIILEHDVQTVFICLDGIPPLPKQLCQKRRRRENFSFSAYLLPGTFIMTRIEYELISIFQSDFVNILGTNLIGEGEQKMIQILKKKQNSSILITHDSDVIILVLIQMSYMQKKKDLIVKIPSFDMIVDVWKLFEEFKKENLVERLLWACVICGNDFFPTLQQFKKLTTKEIFSLLIKYKNIHSFEDISSNKKCTCNHEDAKNYVALYKWFLTYFTNNDFVSTTPYTSEQSPCIACILSVIDEQPQLTNICTQESHLAYVLSKEHNHSHYL